MANTLFSTKDDIYTTASVWNTSLSSDTASSTPFVNCSSVTETVHPRQETWVIPLVVLASLNITAIIAFEVYVLYKSCGSRRHLFLGQMLLLGLFICSLLGFAFVPTPHWFTCTLIRAGVGIGYVMVFSALLVKLVFLLSLHVGVYLSAAYQGLLLFFAIAVQVVVAAQWLVYRPAEVIIVVDALERDKSLSCYATCVTPTSDMIVSLVYSMLLIAGVTALAIRARTVPENHGESMYIGAAIGLIIPLWITWILVASVTDSRYHDACIAFGVVISATVIFLVLFLPKGRQLASLSREGIYMDDGFSSVNQSIYTPSFYHLKPPIFPFVKQGTLVKPLTSTFPPHPADRGIYVPQHFPSRLWRYTNHPAALQLPAPLHPSADDLYLPTERYLFSPPGVKLYRSPLY